MIRTFLAVELTDDVRKALVACQDTLKKDVPSPKWVRPHAMHLTLKFLGDIDETQIDPLREATHEAVGQWPEFSVAVQGLGVFPHLRHPRVLWVDIADGRERVVEVAESLDRGLEAVGFSREAKTYSPHLTLARIKEKGREVSQALTTHGYLMAPWVMGMLPVDRVCLFQSERRPSGSVYTKLWEVPLGGNRENTKS